MLEASPTSAAHYIRTLKEAGLWFRVGRGKTNAPVTASHLINVALAYVGGSPVEGPANVGLLRSMRIGEIHYPPGLANSRKEVFRGTLPSPVDIYGVTIYQTLGETLDGLAMSGTDHRITVVFNPGAALVAVNGAKGDERHSIVFKETKRPKPEPLTVLHSVTLCPALFHRMSELLGVSPGITKHSSDERQEAHAIDATPACRSMQGWRRRLARTIA
jgi:hypothetical protein